jgi:hypothetical protein
MRPAHLLHHYLREQHVAASPILPQLGALDAALDALVLALTARHPRLAHRITPDEVWDHELRRAQTVAALALALQGALADYQNDDLERVELALARSGLP